MMLSAYIVKLRAVKALRGNWQTAMLVTFFAGILVTAYSLVQVNYQIDPGNVTMEAVIQAAEDALAATPLWMWWLMIGLRLLSAIVSPVLELGSNHYFVSRIGGIELGFSGLFSRRRLFGKAFLLRLYMDVKIFLWSLLFFVPGMIAAIRYSMAPYYLAENPSLSIGEAVKKSKETMRHSKANYFWLELSFLGWAIAAMALQLFLADINMTIAIVAYQFAALYVQTYRNGAVAAFFLAISGVEAQLFSAKEETAAVMQYFQDSEDTEDDDRGGFPEDDEEA